MNKLTAEHRSQVIAALVEGNSIRATCRMTGAAKGTVLKLLAAVDAIAGFPPALRCKIETWTTGRSGSSTPASAG